jgi:O-antigen/teichoic acid export membrane protein
VNHAHRDTRDIVRGALAILSGFGGRLIARIALIASAGHLFGAANFGRFGETAAILEVLGALGAYGFRRSLQGRLAADEAAGRPCEQRLLEALFLSFAIAMTLSACLWLWSSSLGIGIGAGTGGLPEFCLAVPPLIAFIEVALSATRYRRVMRWEVARTLCRPWSFLILALIAYVWMSAVPEGETVAGERLGVGLLAAYVGSVVVAALISVIGLIRVFGLEPLMRQRPSVRAIFGLAREGFPTAFVDTGAFLFRRMDILILGTVSGPEVTGVYYMAQQVATVPEKIRYVFEPMVAPVVAQARIRRGQPESSDRSEEWRQIPVVCRWILTLHLALLPALVVFGGDLLGLLGPGFEVGALVLIFLVLGELADGSSALSELPAIFYTPRVPPLIIGSTLVLEGAAVAFLASRFGAPGAAAGFMLAMVGLAFGRAMFARSAFGIVFDARVYRKPLISALLVWSALMAAKDLVSPLPVAILCAVLCSVGIYFGILRILGVPEEDRGLLTALRRS